MKKLGVLLLSLLLITGLLPQTAYAEESPDFDQEVTQYLDEISATRGLEVTKEMLEASMAQVGQDFTDFQSIDEVRNYFGEVIQSDYGNLKNILDTYQLTMPELQQLLANYGEALTDYIFLDELEFAVYYYSTDSAPAVTDPPTEAETPTEVPVFDEDMLSSLLKTMDLSEQEIQNLSDYMSSMEDYFSDPLFLLKMNGMQKRLESLSNIDEKSMTDEQLDLFTDWFHDFFDLFRLQPVFYVLENGKETPLSIDEAIRDKDFPTKDFKLALYSVDSKLLADFIMKHDQLEALFGNIGPIADEFGSAINDVEQASATDHSYTAPKTEKGGKLPKTSADYLPGLALGLLLLMSGLFMYKKATHEKKKIN